MSNNRKNIERFEAEELIQLLKTLSKDEKILALGTVKGIELMSRYSQDEEAS